ncbi:MAG: hypothetical protein WBC74_05640 [Candidatus Omnitrophota bacterium]
MKLNETWNLMIELTKLAIWKMGTLAKFVFDNATSVVAVLAILAVIFSLYKALRPDIKFKVISCYHTLDIEKKGLFILKLQTTSNVDLVVDDLAVNVAFKNDKTYAMMPFLPRLKGTIFVMRDLKGKESSYKLLKPLQPDLRINGIKQGNNEYYISLKSMKPFEDSPIKLWSFKLKSRQHMLAIPNIPFVDRKTLTVEQPEEKDLYFDDLLFEKISDEERKHMLDKL